MTTQEITKLIKWIKSSYSETDKRKTSEEKTEEIKNMVAAWSFLLEDYKAEDIFMAFKMFVSTSGKAYAPSVAELIGMVNKRNEKDEMSASEAWAIVEKAIRNSLYGAEEEFEKFPPEIKAVVGNPSMLRSWGQGDINALGTVVASNFLRCFEANKKERIEKARTTGSAREWLTGSSEATGMIEEKHG